MTLSALRGAERAAALAAGDIDGLGTETSDQMRKLSFLKAGPEKEIYTRIRCKHPPRPFS